MIARVLFLDIDGVLNNHAVLKAAGCCGIDRGCVAQLNRIIRAAEPSIVLSSAWRYILHGKDMTLRGFEYLLRTHGAAGIHGRIVGCTCRDEDCAQCGHRHTRRQRPNVDDEGRYVCRRCERPSSRGDQINYWLREHGPVSRYVVLDDGDFGIREAGHPFVQTDGTKGLTVHKASVAIRMLLGRGNDHA
jgi:hypothetical protein